MRIEYSMIYGSVKYTQVRHALYCKKCFVTVESIGSLVMCKCGSIGIDEDRILGNLEDMEPRSMYVATIRGKKIWLPQWVIETSFHTLKARGDWLPQWAIETKGKGVWGTACPP